MTKSTRLGEPESFICRPTVVKGPMTGAGSGLVNPGRIAEREIGEINWGEAMAYMTRRFGPPNIGSDSYKEIADWALTTPMPGVHLTVNIAPHGTWLLFGYLIDEDLEGALMGAKQARNEAWRAAFLEWNVATHGGPPPSWSLYDEGRETTPEERSEANAETSRRATQFREIVGDDVVADDLLGEMEKAIARTLRDLKRTVGVRDQDISVQGLADGAHRPVKPFRHAGDTVPDYAFDDDMGSVYSAIHRLGGGRKGLRRLKAIIDREVPKGD